MEKSIKDMTASSEGELLLQSNSCTSYAKYTKIKYHLTKIPTYEGNHMSREIIIRDLVNQRA